MSDWRASLESSVTPPSVLFLIYGHVRFLPFGRAGPLYSLILFLS